MTKKQRERWETKTLQKVRKNLQTNLALLTLRSTEDKKEIENRVMAEIQEAVASISDYRIEECSWMIQSFESKADSMALDILQEQDMEREQFEWGFKR